MTTGETARCATPRRWSMTALLALIMLSLSGCGLQTAANAAPAAGAPKEITVFAAASLTEAFGEIGRQFELGHPGVRVIFSFGGSQQLLAQLEQGAPADVLATASAREMDAAEAAGLLAPGSRHDFARNELVIIYHPGSQGDLQSVSDLARPGLKLDLADPSVPVGHYSLNFLDAAARDPALGADFKARVLKNVVSYEQSVKAVVSKVELGEADAGIVYISDARGVSPSRLGTVGIPTTLNQSAVYPLAVLASSSHPRSATAFEAFVVSAQGQRILEKHGFISVQASSG